MLFVIIAVLLIVSTPSITVTAETLQVGRATIERRFIGAVTPFSGKEATAERGPRLNGLAYLCIRGWVDPVVRIEITDPSDPTPYWLTSTRRPGTTDGGAHHHVKRPGAWHSGDGSGRLPLSALAVLAEEQPVLFAGDLRAVTDKEA